MFLDEKAMGEVQAPRSRSSVAAYVGGAAFAVASGLASAVATPIDVTSVTDQISSTLTPIGLIGAGVLLVIVGIKTYKWVRRAM